jgi:hypothetical protein
MELITSDNEPNLKSMTVHYQRLTNVHMFNQAFYALDQPSYVSHFRRAMSCLDHAKLPGLGTKNDFLNSGPLVRP